MGIPYINKVLSEHENKKGTSLLFNIHYKTLLCIVQFCIPGMPMEFVTPFSFLKPGFLFQCLLPSAAWTRKHRDGKVKHGSRSNSFLWICVYIYIIYN